MITNFDKWKEALTADDATDILMRLITRECDVYCPLKVDGCWRDKIVNKTYARCRMLKAYFEQEAE